MVGSFPPKLVDVIIHSTTDNNGSYITPVKTTDFDSKFINEVLENDKFKDTIEKLEARIRELEAQLETLSPGILRG